MTEKIDIFIKIRDTLAGEAFSEKYGHCYVFENEEARKKYIAMQVECARLVEKHINEDSLSCIEVFEKYAKSEATEAEFDLSLRRAVEIDNQKFLNPRLVHGDTNTAIEAGLSSSLFGIGWCCLSAAYGANFVNCHEKRKGETSLTNQMVEIALKHFPDANETTMKRMPEPTIEEYDRLLKKNLQRVVELEREVAELKAAMTDQEKKEFKEVTGFDTPEQWLSWEKGYKDGQDIILTFIAKWDGSTNSALGTMLNSKFSAYAVLTK